MKKVFSVLFTTLLVFCLAFPAAANEYTLITDKEELLTAEEVSSLADTAMSLKQEYNVNVMIVTVPSFLGKSAQDFSDDFYDEFSDCDDGVLFLLSMGQREWYISTAGTMIYALTDYGIQQIGEGSIDYIGQGDYYGLIIWMLTKMELPWTTSPTIQVPIIMVTRKKPSIMKRTHPVFSCLSSSAWPQAVSLCSSCIG